MAERRPGRTGPKYRQIADALRADIASGRYKPDDRLPTKTALQKRFGGVAVNTVERAIEVLRQEGLVESTQGAGMYVRKAPEAPADRVACLEKRIDELEVQMMEVRAVTGLEAAQPGERAEAQL